MQFEFDPFKSEANAAKHGINFEQAQLIWRDPDRLEIPSRYPDEPRQLVIGRAKDRIWTAIVTERQGITRLISVRCARNSEKALYDEQQDD